MQIKNLNCQPTLRKMLTSLEDSQKNFGQAQNFFTPSRFRGEARDF